MAGHKREARLRTRASGHPRFFWGVMKDVDARDIDAKQSFVASRGHDEFKAKLLLLVMAGLRPGHPRLGLVVRDAGRCRAPHHEG
jgi:hypothetical protein